MAQKAVGSNPIIRPKIFIAVLLKSSKTYSICGIFYLNTRVSRNTISLEN